MFKKFRESAYSKAAITLLICGGILIVFNNWISKSRISLGFEAINDTLAPIYIGIICTFLMCPVYNAVVKYLYAKMLAGAMSTGAQVGVRRVYGDIDPSRVDGEERRRFLATARAVASAICFIIVVGVIALMVYAIVPQVLTSGIELFDTLPERLNALSDWLSVHFAKFPMLAKWVDDIANVGTKDILAWVQEHIISGDAVSIATTISSGVMSAVGFVADLVIGILIMIYLLNYKEKLFAIVRKIIAASCKQKTQDGLYEFSDIVNETFVGFIVGRIIDSAIIGVLTYIVLLVFKFSFAPMIAVIVGVTNVIPFFGPFIGAIPSFLILMLEDPMQGFWFLVIILIIQQLDGNVIGPSIVRNVIGIESFWVLVAVLIGGGLFGFAGMVFGVPVFAVIYRYADKMTMRKLRKNNKASHTSDYFTLEQFGIDADDINLEKKSGGFTLLKRFSKKETVEEETIEGNINQGDENSELSTEGGLDVPINRASEDLESIKERIARELMDENSEQ